MHRERDSMAFYSRATIFLPHDSITFYRTLTLFLCRLHLVELCLLIPYTSSSSFSHIHYLLVVLPSVYSALYPNTVKPPLVNTPL